jgi:hypothetical protein
MFKFQTRPTLSKRAHSLSGCCCLQTTAHSRNLYHLTAIATTDLLRNSLRLELLSRLQHFLFDSVMVPFKMMCHEIQVQKWTTCRIHSRTSVIPSSQWPSFLWLVSVIIQIHTRSCEQSLFATRSSFSYSFVSEKGDTRMRTGFIWLRIWILETWWYIGRIDAIRAGWRSGKTTDLDSEGSSWLS